MTSWRKLVACWLPPLAAVALIWAATFLYINDQRNRLLDGGRAATANLAQAFEADNDAPRAALVALLLTLIVLGLAAAAASQRRRAEAAQSLTAQVLEHVGVGILVVSPLGRIRMFNARTRAILSLPAAIRPGSHYSELIDAIPLGANGVQEQPAAGPPRGKSAARPWSNEPPILRRILPDGRVIETRTVALEDGTMVRSFTDVTAAEEAQITLTEARGAAEAAMRARARFLAAMSHEIRTPLNGILGVNDLLRSTPLAGEQRDYTDIIQQAGTHLLEMLTEVLDYSKIDQNGIELDSVVFDPGAMPAQIAAILAPRVESKDLLLDITIANDLPRRVVGDPHRVRQVLLNLISNAIKFTTSGRIDVSLEGQALPDGQWRLDFAVKDTGIGIAPEAIGKLFQEFTQTDGSISRRFGGIGLGLAICRRVVDAMGGSISVESTPGVGSLFRFSIPAVAAASATEPDNGRRSTNSAPEPAKTPTVLLVEDNQVNRFVARHMLERSGYKVVVAPNGLEALSAVGQGGIDLVLMDVMMPEMDGLAATRAIRALEPPRNEIPIIGLSANAFRSDEDDARAAGMNGFLTKPIDRVRLMAEIASALNSKPPAAPGEGAPKEASPREASPREAMENPVQYLRETLGDATAEAVITVFCADAPNLLRRLREHASAGAGAAVAREAHALAGTAGAVGLMSLAEEARAMERSARRDHTVPDEAAIAALESLLGAAIARLQVESVP